MVGAMNPRVTTMLVGVVMLVLGLLALLYPRMVMDHVLGFGVSPAYSANFVYGELRATYGGLFIVMGIYVVLSAMDTAANRGRLLFVGMLWLGACAGRLFGAFVDGSPGIWGWLTAAFELAIGGILVAVAQMSPADRPQPATFHPETPIGAVPPPVTPPPSTMSVG